MNNTLELLIKNACNKAKTARDLDITLYQLNQALDRKLPILTQEAVDARAGKILNLK